MFLHNVLYTLLDNIIKSMRKPLRFGVKDRKIAYIENIVSSIGYIHNRFL